MVMLVTLLTVLDLFIHILLNIQDLINAVLYFHVISHYELTERMILFLIISFLNVTSRMVNLINKLIY